MTDTPFMPQDDPKDKLPNIVIVISGSGTNMVAIAEQVKSQQLEAKISAVICNRPEAAGVQKAKDRDIPVEIVDHTEFNSREDFDIALMRAIDEYDPDLVVLAGFMRILTPSFVQRYEGRMLNIHPSLLPKHKGVNTHKKALEAGDAEHGVTIHFVTEDLDGGPNIIQAIVPVLDGDDEVSLSYRVQQQEYVIYPIAIKWFIEGRLTMKQGLSYLDNQALPSTGLQLNS